MTWSFDPLSYKVGDAIFVQVRIRWGNDTARRYIVSKITPTGRIIAERESDRIQISARGRIGSSDAWVISPETAGKLHSAERIHRAWMAIAKAGADIETAARRKDCAALDEAVKALAQGMETRRAETEGLGAKPCAHNQLEHKS